LPFLFYERNPKLSKKSSKSFFSLEQTQIFSGKDTFKSMPLAKFVDRCGPGTCFYESAFPAFK